MAKKQFYNTISHFLLSILFFIAISSCEKFDHISSDPNIKLNFSSDTILFDTVFTSIGSITKKFLIYNSSNENIIIEKISLGLAEESSYRINVDGISNTLVNNIEISSHDSLYVFIRALLNPNDLNSPFIVEDEVNFLTNGNHQSIKLISWGQNANYIIADQISADGLNFKSITQNNKEIVWDNTKPYLIYGYAKVDSAASLRISEGAQIYFHKNSGLWIANDAQFLVEGSLENRVVFQGDRLDEDYSDITNQWDKILIEEGSREILINYAIIKNGSTGLLLTNQTESNSNITISNSIIDNMSQYCIKSNNFNISAHNNLIINAGQSLLNISGRGNLMFIHNTMVNYWQHSFRNAFSIHIDGETSFNSTVYFGNCIIEGNKSDELLILNEDASGLEYIFDHCSLKTTLDLTNESAYISIIQSPTLLFENTEIQSYYLSPDSEVINHGKPSLGLEFPLDIVNQDRSISPDLGAIEFK